MPNGKVCISLDFGQASFNLSAVYIRRLNELVLRTCCALAVGTYRRICSNCPGGHFNNQSRAVRGHRARVHESCEIVF
eukprot:6174895-Pleurochrysis_carterae.AAC.4